MILNQVQPAMTDNTVYNMNMEHIIIDNLLALKNKTSLDLMVQSNMEAIAKSVTAFINTNGGSIILGMDANQTIMGIEDAGNEIRKIREHLRAHIKPTAPVSLDVMNYNGKDIILIHAWAGSRKPYQYQRIFYNRHNENTIIAGFEDINQIIEQRKEADSHWERLPIGAELTDLDTEEIKKTIEAYGKYTGNESITLDNESFLTQAGLLQAGKLTHACVLLFGKHPTHFIPQAKIRLTIYASKYPEERFILDDKYFEGNLFENSTGIFNYLDTVLEDNLKAIREGIINAIVHRNYYPVKSFLHISLFSDRTEISNLGSLPPEMTLADLRAEHPTVLQNPGIAFICFLRGYIELLGVGTLEMTNNCHVNNYIEPEWTCTVDTVTVVFQGVSHHQAVEGVIEGANKGAFEAFIKGAFGGTNEGITEGTKNKQKQLLVTIDQNPGIRVPGIEKLTKIPVKTIERYIKQLKAAHLIEFRGKSPQTGGYYLTIKN